jgi:hypothetical protein
VPVGTVFDVPFVPILIGNLSATRTCSARDFVARSAGGNGAAGHVATYVDLTDVSSTPCRLEGYPQVVAEVPGGSSVAATGGAGIFTTRAVLPVTVAAGMTLLLTLETERDCPLRYANPNIYPQLFSNRVSIGLPGGGSLNVAASQDVLCGLTVAPYLQAPPLGPPPPAPPAFALQPEIEDLSSVSRGTVSFRVVLPNLTTHPVSLSPCPWFTERSRAPESGLFAYVFYLVNCAAAPSALQPGDALVLQMDVPVPTLPGSVELDWSWGTPYQQGGEQLTGPQELAISASIVISLSPLLLPSPSPSGP